MIKIELTKERRKNFGHPCQLGHSPGNILQRISAENSEGRTERLKQETIKGKCHYLN